MHPPKKNKKNERRKNQMFVFHSCGAIFILGDSQFAWRSVAEWIRGWADRNAHYYHDPVPIDSSTFFDHFGIPFNESVLKLN